jgi:hypothetical protein
MSAAVALYKCLFYASRQQLVASCAAVVRVCLTVSKAAHSTLHRLLRELLLLLPIAGA